MTTILADFYVNKAISRLNVHFAFIYLLKNVSFLLLSDTFYISDPDIITTTQTVPNDKTNINVFSIQTDTNLSFPFADKYILICSFLCSFYVHLLYLYRTKNKNMAKYIFNTAQINQPRLKLDCI